MKNAIASIALALWAAPTWAQHEGHGAAPPAPAATAPSADSYTEGEILAIDKSTGRLTIRHGEIRNLDMPPMTMLFGVRDPALLDAVRVGERVRFVAAKENGRIFVTEVRPLP